MKIRLATRQDLDALQRIDTDPEPWQESDYLEFVQSFGQIKVALEGEWHLGWIAYRKVNGLIIVERLILPNLPGQQDLEGAVALRLMRHAVWLCRGSDAIDVALPDTRLEAAKILVGDGYTVSFLPEYYQKERQDAVLLHKKLKDGDG